MSRSYRRVKTFAEQIFHSSMILEVCLPIIAQFRHSEIYETAKKNRT